MDDSIFKKFHLKNSIFDNFKNPRNIFYKIREIFVCFCLTIYSVQNQNMFTIEIEDGREVP